MYAHYVFKLFGLYRVSSVSYRLILHLLENLADFCLKESFKLGYHVATWKKVIFLFSLCFPSPFYKGDLLLLFMRNKQMEVKQKSKKIVYFKIHVL